MRKARGGEAFTDADYRSAKKGLKLRRVPKRPPSFYGPPKDFDDDSGNGEPVLDRLAPQDYAQQLCADCGVKIARGAAAAPESVAWSDLGADGLARCVPCEEAELRAAIERPADADAPAATPVAYPRPRGAETWGLWHVQLQEWCTDQGERLAGSLHAMLHALLSRVTLARPAELVDLSPYRAAIERQLQLGVFQVRRRKAFSGGVIFPRLPILEVDDGADDAPGDAPTDAEIDAALPPSVGGANGG